MNVKDLIDELSKVDKNAKVIIQKDAEGNDYSPLAMFWEGAYAPETSWRGHAGIIELTDELAASGYTEDDIVDGAKALFLVPIN